MLEKKNGVILVFIVALVNLVADIIIYAWAGAAGLSNDQWFAIYSNLIIILWSTIVTLCFLFVLMSFGMNTGQGKVWFFMGIGQIITVIGDVIYFVLSVFIFPGTNPFPSIADYFWSITYVFLFIGFALQFKLATVKLSMTEIGTVLIITGIGAVITWFFILGPTIFGLGHRYWSR